MENLVVILVLILLTGCTSVPKVTHTWENMQPKLVVEVTEDFGPIRKKYKNKNIQGLTEFLRDGTCIIYIPPLRDVYDDKAMCIAGHELWHCLVGHFHDDKHADSCNW